MPATKRVSRTPQASTTHADFVHTRKVRHFPSSESAPNAQVRRSGTNHREGKGLTPAEPPAGRNARVAAAARRTSSSRSSTSAAASPPRTATPLLPAPGPPTPPAAPVAPPGTPAGTLSGTPAGAGVLGTTGADDPGTPPLSPAAPPVSEPRLAMPATGNPAVPEVSPSGAAPVRTALPLTTGRPGRRHRTGQETQRPSDDRPGGVRHGRRRAGNRGQHRRRRPGDGTQRASDRREERPDCARHRRKRAGDRREERPDSPGHTATVPR